MEPLIEGMAEVKLSKETKTRIRAPWSKALIVKVFGRTVGFNYLTFKLNTLWKPATRMDCVNLGNDYFLIKFYFSDDYDKVLRGSPWFIGDHFLAIKPWEPYFKASGENLSSVAVWVRFPELPIKFYDLEVLKEIGSAIGPILRIDSYTATGSRGSYARLCIQIDLEKPLINSIRIGRLVQQVKYEGISSLCFCCGRLGHKQENCCYKIKENNRSGVEAGKSTNQSREEDKQEDSRSEESPNQVSEQDDTDSNFGPWMLVTRKRNGVKNGRPRSPLSSEMKGDISPKGLNVQRGENMEGISGKMVKSSVWSNHTEATHAVRVSSVPGFAPNEDLGNLEVRFTSSPKQREAELQNDRKLQMGSLGAGSRGYRSKGETRAKSLKRLHPSSSSQRSALPKNLQRREHGGSSSGSRRSDKEGMGDLALEQASGNPRRDHPANKGNPDEGSEMVRSRNGSGAEEYLSDHSGESQNRGASVRSFGMGSNAQPMVELHDGHPIDFMGGVRNLEQAEKAIGEAALRRIRMGDPGKAVGGSEGVGYNTDGEPPNAEAYPVAQTGGEVRRIDELQGRCGGNSEVHDAMETGVEALEGVTEESRIEHGGSSCYES